MQNSTTVVIAAAGLGSRLGLSLPKSLIVIDEKSILCRQLELLKNYDDIRIVVGYHAEQVIKHAQEIRKDILFVFNHNYVDSTPLNSLYLASRYAKEKILYLDGDLLITPESLDCIEKFDVTTLGITKTYSCHPVCVEIKKNEEDIFITKFTREYKEYEWSGLMFTERDKIENRHLYVYQMFEKYLPLKSIIVDVCEVDTMQDLEYAKKWIKEKF